MEKITDVLDGIKDRLTSPIVVSFIISWSVFNWEIFVALFWWDAKQLELAGYENIFQFISCQINAWHSFFGPLLSAIVYTFLSPLFKAGVSALNAFAVKLEDKWTLNISKDQNIPMDRFIKLRDLYTEQRNKFEKLIKEESKTVEKLQEVQVEKLDLQKELSEYLNKLAEKEKELKNCKFVPLNFKRTQLQCYN